MRSPCHTGKCAAFGAGGGGVAGTPEQNRIRLQIPTRSSERTSTTKSDNMGSTRAFMAALVFLSCFAASGAQRTVCTEEAVADIVFLVDGSWSIGAANFQQVRDFLVSLVDSFDVGPEQVRIGLVQYSTSPVTEFLLNTYSDKQEILRKIQTLPYRGGGTKTGSGLEFMLAQHFVKRAGSRGREGVPQFAVVITDGQSQDSVREQAEMVKRRGITLYAIGIKEAVLEELQEIASDPDDKHVYSVSDFAALQGISQSVIQVLCTTVEEAKRQIAQVSQECRKATVADIVFLVDGSSSIGTDNFQEMRVFLHAFVEGLDIGANKVRVGLAQFSNEPHQEFLLGELMEKRALLERIDGLEYRTGGTYTGKALRFLRSAYFTGAAGSRVDQSVPQIVVVITDGNSADDVQAPARELRRSGVIVFAIGIGTADSAELQLIANSPHERFLVSIDSYQALQRLTETLLKTVCVSVESQIQALAPRFADVFVLVDGTAQSEISQVRNLLLRLFTQLNIGSEAHRVGLAQFGSDTKVEFLLNKYRTKDEVLLHLKNRFRLRPGRERNLGRALEHARTSFFSTAAGSRIAEGFPQFLVVVTAGRSQDEFTRAARSVRAEGVTVISIGLPKTDRNDLQMIASGPYVYQTSSQGIGVIPKDVKSVIESKEAYLGLATGPSDCRSAKMADIVFIVDESASILPQNFQLVRTFIHRIVDGLDVGFKNVRVGIVLYSDSPKAEVYLNSFKEKDDILQFIKILPYRGGGTQTGAALNFTRESVFTKSAGSRQAQGVQQLAIVITDGKSQDEVSNAAALLRRDGVTVYAVGVKDADPKELQQIASHPARKHVFIVDSFAKLGTLEKSLQKLLCYNIIRTAFAAPARTFNLKSGCVQTEEADFYFLIDHSGSIYPRDFQDMKKFILEFLHMFRIGPNQVRVGVVKFADGPTLEFTLTEYTDSRSLESAVDRIVQVGGGTEIGRALTFMGPLFKNAVKSRGEKVPEFLIVITDGKSSDKVEGPAKELRAQGVTIYAIGVRGADEAELLEIAGSPEKKFFVNDFDALKPIKDEIVTDICSEVVCKDMEGDVLFLIDGSGSIEPEDFQKMKNFMVSMVDKSAIGLDKVRLGVLQFSVNQQEEFPLNKFYDKGGMKQAISSMQQLGGGTLTGAALGFASQYFDSLKGGRLNVRQFLIVITDGEAQDEVAQSAEKLRNKGVIIYSIGVLNANNSQLLEISGSQHRVFSERDFDALKYLETQILFKICHPETECKTKTADMIFLVDGSSSILAAEFQSMLKFMTSMVNNTEVGENRVRFGTILYSDTPKTNFTLNQYFTKREVRRAVAALQAPGGSTYTALGLQHSLTYFDAHYGGRAAEKVPQILMVITDGEATDKVALPVWSRAVREKGIKIYGVGVGGADRKELETMTDDPEKVFYVDNYQALEVLYKNLSNVVCRETKPVCDKERADLVILMDGSTSINEEEFKIMKKFMSDLAASFHVSQEHVRIGMAQFSYEPQKEFYLNQHDNIADIKERILALQKLEGGTNIGRALHFIREFFEASAGSRIAQGVSQSLLVITDGDSEDEVEHPANLLRALGINMFVIGVGHIHSFELLQIAGSQNRFFTVQNFAGLEKIKANLVDSICKPHDDRPEIKGCSVDIGIGFDVSRRPQGELLFSGQPKLQAYLPEIIRYASSLDDLCCTAGKIVKANIGFLVAGENGRVIDDYGFEVYDEQVVRKVMALKTAEATFLNVPLLQAFSAKFHKNSRAGVKILIIFTDGIDDNVEKLEAESDRLRRAGIQALLLVGLDGVRSPSDLQMIEYGRGFGYKQPLSIGMQNVASVMLKQIDTVAGRECCGVMCKCSGQEGVRGPRGSPGTKGVTGSKGHSGYPGEEGGVGERGPPGLNGTQGLQGCPGNRGLKGSRGYRGNRGDDGDHGLDGVHGEQGVTGLAGAAGDRGSPGSPGRRGLRGEPGVRGQSGLRGDPGESGVDNTVRDTGPEVKTHSSTYPRKPRDTDPCFSLFSSHRELQERMGFLEKMAMGETEVLMVGEAHRERREGMESQEHRGFKGALGPAAHREGEDPGVFLDQLEVLVFLGHRGNRVRQVTKDCLEVGAPEDRRASWATLGRKE
ncbi:hypothetical protein AAFF_G00308050 [Aldrovandia affinis]|uniref:VWFA domain-containing protein n=1 Tax=Aldrovandia affinis TaxID=143900 RepID=A0AAD7R8J2_9TELE|nr:hypothetical protein AAFF_G00308050 [Aldrovandia affinis]